MPGQRIRPAVEKFLESGSSGALLIRGRWGVGKSYFWRYLIKELKREGAWDGTYAYISLFGLNNLVEVKEAIVISYSDPSKPQPNTLARLWKGSKEVIPQLKDLIGVSLSVGFPFVRKALICFDDLERKGKELEVETIIGLISMLKEERECKVVLDPK